MATPVFTPGQLTFIARYAKDTGLNPNVVAAQVFNEMNGSASASRQAAGNHNWLNIGWTDSGQRGTGNQLWMNPITAADASARWIKGQWDVPGFGRASSGVQGILKSVGLSPAQQIAALQNSGWASGRYPNLPSIYQSVSGLRLPNVPAGGGVPTAAATVPAGTQPPFKGPALTPLPAAPAVPAMLQPPNITGAILGSMGKSPGDQLAALMTAATTPRPALSPQTTPPPPTPLPKNPALPPTPADTSPPGGPLNVNRWAKIGAGANREGVSTKPAVFNAVARIARQLGQPLTISTGTNHYQMVRNADGSSTGRQSQHWTGDAADIVYGHGTGPDNIDPALTKLGQAALIAAGMPPAEARKSFGGVYNVGGWNILFNTSQNGNHYNHLHVGV